MHASPGLLPDWLAFRAATAPEHHALHSGGRRWTHAELDADVSRMARRLLALGVCSGDRVATLLHNGAAAVVMVHAALRAGAILVPLNVRLADAELAWQIGDCQPTLLVCDDRTAPRAAAAGAAHASLTIEPVGDVRAVTAATHDAAPLRLAHPADAVLAIIYTSGTTGRPKGTMITVANCWWSALGSALNLGTRDDDRWLACLPLFHVGGLSIVLRAAIYGITALVHDGFDADAVNHAIDDEQVTIVSVVAVMLQRLLDARGDRPFPPTLRCVLLGGGPSPLELLERCAARRLPVMQSYGLTETASQVATLAPADALTRVGSSGRALYPNEVQIRREDGTIAGPAEAGEIVVRGPVVTAGYAGRPDVTARIIVDGWLHTGDIGQLDSDGYLHVLDRRDDLIITGGENVYPAEVEAVLLAHPWVDEAAVVGDADARWGQRVLAIVRLATEAPAGASNAELVLREHCRTRLASYKVPAEVRVATEPLPRTASGKLRRGHLRQTLHRAHERDAHP